MRLSTKLSRLTILVVVHRLRIARKTEHKFRWRDALGDSYDLQKKMGRKSKANKPRGIAKVLHDSKVEAERERDGVVSDRTAHTAARRRRANPATQRPAQRDQNTLASENPANNVITDDQKRINFLLERIESLKREVDDFRHVVATLTHEIRAEDGAFRKKYNAKRRQVARLKKLLNEHGTAQLQGLVADDEDDKEDAQDDVASTLLQLANEATQFLAKGLHAQESADAEGMSFGEPESFSSPQRCPEHEPDGRAEP